jgi:hypothetical protein
MQTPLSFLSPVERAGSLGFIVIDDLNDALRAGPGTSDGLGVKLWRYHLVGGQDVAVVIKFIHFRRGNRTASVSGTSTGLNDYFHCYTSVIKGEAQKNYRLDDANDQDEKPEPEKVVYTIV